MTGQIPAESILAQNAEAIRTLGKRVIADVIEIGRRLSESKQLCGHGNWLPWLKREFEWSEDTAENYINLASLDAKFRTVRNLDLPMHGLYLLAKPSTPNEVRAEVIARAESGEALTVADVRRAIHEAPGEGQQQPKELKRSAADIAEANRAAVKPKKPKPDVSAPADRAEKASAAKTSAKLIDAIEQLERINVSATIARMSNDDRVTLMTLIVRANAWLNKTAVEVAISGGANLGKLAPPNLRYEALSFLHAAAARIEAELADRGVRESAPGAVTARVKSE